MKGLNLMEAKIKAIAKTPRTKGKITRQGQAKRIKPAIKGLNVRLLRKVQRHILEEPRRFIMRALSVKGKPGETILGDFGNAQTLPWCGTAACIAGWINILSNIDGDACSAEKLLGLDFYGGAPLFYERQWPSRFRQDFAKARTPTARANIAVRRISYFIKEGK
jgi:hypothetical protein